MRGDHMGTPPSDEKTDTAENITSQQFLWKLQVVWFGRTCIVLIA